MPRKQRVGRRPRLHRLSDEYNALLHGPLDPRSPWYRPLSDDVETLWRDERERLDQDPREFAAFWRFEHELDWDAAIAASHLFSISERSGYGFTDEEIAARAPELAREDPRLD